MPAVAVTDLFINLLAAAHGQGSEWVGEGFCRAHSTHVLGGPA